MVRPAILYTRQLRSFTGGHLKVFDYMGHVAQDGLALPRLYLTPDSSLALAASLTPPGVERVSQPQPADCHFVAGMDWLILDKAGIDLANARVINLVQHVRHADPADPRYPFLTRPALRICVGPEVGDALRATGIVNGPIEVIANGVDLSALAAHRRVTPSRKVFIGGLKNPPLGRACAAALTAAGVPVDACLTRLPREAFLDRLADAEVCILLPTPTEGFFLPALEAMVLGVAAVVPDCVGARSFCRHEETCLVSDFTVATIVAAAMRLWQDPSLRERLRAAAIATAQCHSLERERAEFLPILHRMLGGRGAT